MRKSAVAAAKGLVDSRVESLAELWIREFEDDVEAHDDALQERLEREFIVAFDEAASELTAEYGPPARVSQEDEQVVPMGGTFRSAVWWIRDNELWLAAAHEDREVPFVLLMGCAYRQNGGDT